MGNSCSSLLQNSCGGVEKTEETQEAKRPDFSGTWLCTKCEGDVDDFLVKMGASVVHRATAWLQGLDVGITIRTFVQNGDDLDIDVQAQGNKRFTQIFTIGGGIQIVEDEDGAVLVEPTWERSPPLGWALRTEVSTSDGTKLRTVRQFLERQGALVIQVQLHSGPRVVWQYEKQSRGFERAPKASFPEPPRPPLALLLKDGMPNFNGRWRTHRCEGDMELFFEESGMTWAQRKTLKAVGWGVGVTERGVTQVGHDFEIVDSWPLGSSIMKFQVGAGEQETIGRGAGMLVTPVMEYPHVLQLVTQAKDKSTAPNCPVRYFLVDEELVMVLSSPSGRLVKYFHVRC